jgi:hypothetical protein
VPRIADKQGADEQPGIFIRSCALAELGSTDRQPARAHAGL